MHSIDRLMRIHAACCLGLAALGCVVVVLAALGAR